MYCTHDRLLAAQHLAAIVRLAAENLQVFRLSNDISQVHVPLTELANQHVQLQALAFSNRERIPEENEKALFENCVSELQVLCIYQPGTLLRHIASAGKLQELDLSGVHPQRVFELTIMLRSVGNTLRVLRVAFLTGRTGAPVRPVNSSDTRTSECGMCAFAPFICCRLSEGFPLLHTLDIGGDRARRISHYYNADRERVSEHVLAQELHKKVNSARERNCGFPSPHQLRHLILRDTFDSSMPIMEKCLNEFSALVGPEVDLELQSKRATIVFPAGDKVPYFKALQINLLDIQDFPEHSKFDFTRMEVLDVGSKIFIEAYAAHESLRLRMMNFVWESTDTLRELHIDSKVDSSRVMEAICTYVGDILEIASYVESLTFRSSLVDFADKGNTQFQRLLSFMDYIKVLRLTSHALHANDCQLAFGKNLPMFLNAISRACPDLECLDLELAIPIRQTSLTSPEVYNLAWKSLGICRKAVRDFEKALPNCDISSVRSQLNVWQEDLESFLEGPLAIYFGQKRAKIRR